MMGGKQTNPVAYPPSLPGDSSFSLPILRNDTFYHFNYRHFLMT